MVYKQRGFRAKRGCEGGQLDGAMGEFEEGWGWGGWGASFLELQNRGKRTQGCCRPMLLRKLLNVPSVNPCMSACLETRRLWLRLFHIKFWCGSVSDNQGQRLPLLHFLLLFQNQKRGIFFSDFKVTTYNFILVVNSSRCTSTLVFFNVFPHQQMWFFILWHFSWVKIRSIFYLSVLTETFLLRGRENNWWIESELWGL